MKFLTSTILILAVIVLAGSVATVPDLSALMTSAQMSAVSGSGFWGVLACGLAAGVTIVGGAAIITALGAGTTVGLGVAFATSAALHVDVICALLD